MTVTSVADTLRRAKALISQPGHWTQHSEARTGGGSSVMPSNPRATRWCAIGAIRRVDGPYEADATQLLAEAVLGKRKMSGSQYSLISNFNDKAGRLHKTVLAKFDLAIAAAERSGLTGSELSDERQ